MPERTDTLTRNYLLTTIALLAVTMLVCMTLALNFGAGKVSLLHLIQADGLSTIDRTILLEVRLPRVIFAGVLGGALAVAGVVFQALLRNPLADPYVLGVSGGASIGGVLAILLGLGAAGGWLGNIAVPVCAFAGALAALILIQYMATVDGRLTVYTVLLTGVIFNAFAAALIFFIQSIASLERLHDIVFYLMGRIPTPDTRTLVLLTCTIVIATLFLWFMGRQFNALSLGEETATQLGVPVESVKRRTFILGSRLTGLSVAVAGLIGFVGLVVPHMLRLLFGPDHRLLIPAAFLGGGAFLVIADLFARLVLAPNELPVGVITALIGGPFFIYLLRSRSRVYGI